MPPMGEPLISVVIPAYRAHATIAAAVRSVLDGGIAPDQIEILVESDDGSDYAEVCALSPVIRQATSGAIGTGAGPARNRAMARARGQWLAFLDADDTFAPGYLAAILPHARAEGAAAAPLEVVRAGQSILALWQGQDRLHLADLAASGASVRMMVARDACPPFADALSQDVLHAVQIMARAGGSVPLSDRAYRLILSDDTVTAAQDFAVRVHQAYLEHIARIEAWDAPCAAAAADVFRAKIALNRAFTASGTASYYGFVAEVLAQKGNAR